MKLRYIVSVWLVLFVVTGLLPAQVSPQLLKSQSALLNSFSIGKDSTPRVPSRLISLELDDVPLEKALRRVADHFSLRLWYSEAVVPANKKVTASLKDVSFSEAMEYLLASTDLEFMVSEAGQLVMTPKERVEQETGTVVGRVLEARTNKPLIGANVMIEGTGLGASADAEGSFKIERVPPGKYKLRASVVGYGKVSKDITVVAGQITSKDFVLDETAVGLDEVVVTGVAFETRRREIPADIAVITAKQIEQKQASNITDLLKGEIPGVMAAPTGGQYDERSFIVLRGSGVLHGFSSGGTKFYIDDIELSSPEYISTIDPKSIERIEVIKGPHAAALYGTEATSGVIHIITKKGGDFGLDRPKVSALISAGYIESQYTPAGERPFNTNNSIQITGGLNTISYRAGVGYGTVGEWIHGYGSKQLNLSAAMRAVHGPVTAELSAMWSTQDRGYPSADYRFKRWPARAPAGYREGMLFPNFKQDLAQTTIGLNIIYHATSRWVHKLVLGEDNSVREIYNTEPYRFTASDTLIGVSSHSEFNRRSIRYNTTYQQPFGEIFTTRLTAGAEYSLYNTVGRSVRNFKFNEYGDLVRTPLTSTVPSRLKRWTASYSGSFELGFMNRLYATLSSSLKHDPRGYEKTYINPPRVGLSYSEKFETVEVRMRGQYGSAIRPVNPSLVNPASPTPAVALWLPNLDLAPEQRAGWEAGIDLYWGQLGLISITRFDEVEKGSIQQVRLEDGPPIVNQYQNLGDVGIAGYEVQGRLNFGFLGMNYLTLSANYTYVDNVINKLGNQYVPGPTQPYQVGDRVISVPKHSGGGEVNVRVLNGSFALGWQFSGGWRNVDYEAFYDYRYGDAPHRDAGVRYADITPQNGYPGNNVMIDGVPVSRNSETRSYFVNYPTYVKYGLRAEQDVTERISVFLNISDLLNNATADRANSGEYVSPGRITVVGVRVSY